MRDYFLFYWIGRRRDRCWNAQRELLGGHKAGESLFGEQRLDLVDAPGEADDGDRGEGGGDDAD